MLQAREVAELRTLKKEELVKFYGSVVHGKQTRRKLSVHVIGAAERQGATVCEGGDLEPSTIVDDIWSFKRSQELYPCANGTSIK